jgi:hypothetical protein
MRNGPFLRWAGWPSSSGVSSSRSRERSPPASTCTPEWAARRRTGSDGAAGHRPSSATRDLRPSRRWRSGDSSTGPAGRTAGRGSGRRPPRPDLRVLCTELLPAQAAPEQTRLMTRVDLVLGAGGVVGRAYHSGRNRGLDLGVIVTPMSGPAGSRPDIYAASRRPAYCDVRSEPCRGQGVRTVVTGGSTTGVIHRGPPSEGSTCPRDGR